VNTPLGHKFRRRARTSQPPYLAREPIIVGTLKRNRDEEFKSRRGYAVPLFGFLPGKARQA